MISNFGSLLTPYYVILGLKQGWCEQEITSGDLSDPGRGRPGVLHWVEQRLAIIGGDPKGTDKASQTYCDHSY